MTDIVFNICEQMLRNSPEKSFKRLNPALRGTLQSCIEADLPFQPDTFQRIFNKLRGAWWFGDGSGSCIGEHFYTTACELNHATAQQSFENFAVRPAVLWEEDIKTPFRLHVGSKFTWRGRHVTVTSMREDSLVACTYKAYRSPIQGLKVGAEISYNPYYVITSSKREGDTTILSVVKSKDTGSESDVASRTTIPYTKIAEVRRTAKARAKAILDKIAQCNPEKDADKLTGEINAMDFRHFELEEIRAAFQKRKDWLASNTKIEAWRNGENGAWLDVKETILRVKGDRVECSNGNGISKVTATAILPVLLANRKSNAPLSIPVDSYQINRVSNHGVKIGCTLVPWPEIDRLVPVLTPIS
jgi:hypothetical protein